MDTLCVCIVFGSTALVAIQSFAGRPSALHSGEGGALLFLG